MRCSKCNKTYKDEKDKDIVYCNNCGGKLIKDNDNKASDKLILPIIGIVMIGLLFFSIGAKTVYSLVGGDYFYNLFNEIFEGDYYYDDDDYDDDGFIECDKLDWNEIRFKSQFIDERVLYGYVETYDEDDEETSQDISLCNITKTEFNSIKKEFIDIGYNKVDYKDEDTYFAYNEDGYYIELSFYDENQAMISISDPKKFNQIKWPEKGPATMIPKPDGNKGMGRIDDDNSRNFMITLRDITKEEFNNYVKKLKDNGYTSNIRNEENSYESNNPKNGYEVMVDYHANNTMDIRVMYIGIFDHTIK